MTDKYPVEELDEYEDDGTMPGNVQELRNAVVGHRIVRAGHVKGERVYLPNYSYADERFEIELDNGTTVRLAQGGDCCAFTELESFLLNADKIDHVITGIGTTGRYTKWHIYADMGDVLELNVGWSPGNPFYYGYGFYIDVEDANDDR